MSRTSKKRFMSKKMDSEFFFPEENQLIGRVLSSKGRDLLEIEDENGLTYLASMPTKFRNTIWVKRGQFVYLLPIEEGDKVKAEIQHVLDAETVLYVREQKKWPKHFEEDAMKLSRGFKRGGGGENTIDDDMMPPSESDEEDLEDEESDKEGEEDEEVSDEDEPKFSTFNPNRTAAPNQ